MQTDHAKITGVVLAGGQARRMGGNDKGLIVLQGRPLVGYAIDALRPVSGQILINANRNRATYADFGYPVIPDQSSGFDGPLAGILSAMKAAETPYLLTVPCDCPRLQGDLLRRMMETRDTYHADACVAHDGERLHPVVLLLACRLEDSLEAYLAAGQRKIDTWLNQHRLVTVDYSDHPEMFQNVNTREDLAALNNAL